MLRKLRIKFVVIVMVAVFAVLAVVFTAISFNEYQRNLHNVQSALQAAVENTASMSAAKDQRPEGNGNQFRQPSIGKKEAKPGDMVPVAVYRIAEDGSLCVMEAYSWAELDESALQAASDQASQLHEGMGTISEAGLHYFRETVEGTTYIGFADSSVMNDWRSFTMKLLYGGVVILVVIFIASLFLSRWALRPVKQAWDSQRQFVADASHELKTPLTVVLANTSIMLKHPDATIASQSQWLESTQTEAKNMDGLIAEMLDLAQIEEKRNIAHEPLNLSELVDRDALQFESVAFEQGFTLESQIENGLCVQGDATRLDKMVSTLIENAAKYVERGGTVTLNLRKSGDKAVLAVHNTGSYIDPEDLPHIFDRFYRTDKARTSGTGGYGLGLAIARETAREHKGDITAASSKETGTTFTVTLPL